MDREEQVRTTAYKLWEEAGRPEGREQEYWLKAEAIWQENQGRQSEPQPAPASETPAKPKRKPSTRGTARKRTSQS